MMFMTSCTSCFKEYPVNSLLEKEYDVVMAVLAPDTAIQFTRTYPTEVFVGRLIPVNYGNIFHITGVEDPVLYELMLATRQLYFCAYEYDESAEVIISDSVQQVTLTHTGNGVYRDVNRQLTILPEHIYGLSVKKKNGRQASATTRVPSSIDFLTPKEDVVYLVPDAPTDMGKSITIRVTNQGDQFYFVNKDTRSNVSFVNSAYSFQDSTTPWIYFGKTLDDKTRIDTVHAQFEMRAINHDYGSFHAPYGDFGVTPEFFHNLEKTLYDGDVARKSNVKGDDIYGIFGAYNATVKNLTAIALWDSVKSSKAGK
jgi:hypothetical protein